MPTVTIPVSFHEAYTRPQPPPASVDVVGREEDSFRSLLVSLSPHESTFFVFVEFEDTNGRGAAFPIDQAVTIGQVATLVDALTKERGRVLIDNGGRGGDPFEVLSAVFEAIGTVSTAWAGWRLSEAVRYEISYGKRHRAAKDWLRGGTEKVYQPLYSWVHDHISWSEDDFEKTFALHGDDAFRLLRAAGFEFHAETGQWWNLDEPANPFER